LNTEQRSRSSCPPPELPAEEARCSSCPPLEARRRSCLPPELPAAGAEKPQQLPAAGAARRRSAPRHSSYPSPELLAGEARRSAVATRRRRSAPRHSSYPPPEHLLPPPARFDLDLGGLDWIGSGSVGLGL